MYIDYNKESGQIEALLIDTSIPIPTMLEVSKEDVPEDLFQDFSKYKIKNNKIVPIKYKETIDMYYGGVDAIAQEKFRISALFHALQKGSDNVYGVLKQTISMGVVDLPEVLKKVKRMYAGGDLDEAEFEELTKYAIEKSSGVGGTANDADIEALQKRVVIIEEKVVSIDESLTEIRSMLNELLGKKDPDEPVDPVDPDKPKLLDPRGLPVYTDGTVTPKGKIWLFEGKVYKANQPDNYGLSWGPKVLPDMWEDISDGYDLTLLENPVDLSSFIENEPEDNEEDVQEPVIVEEENNEEDNSENEYPLPSPDEEEKNKEEEDSSEEPAE